MNCIIIDDDATARLIINQLCKKSNLIKVQEEFSSAVEAIKYLNEHTVDVVFLDIHMPTFSGFDFLKTLSNPPNIVFTTSDKNFALTAFEYKSVVDYLVKPVSEKRFHKTLEKLSSSPKTISNNQQTSSYNTNFLYVNVDKRLVKINILDIYLIEAKGDYVNIKTEQKNYIVHATLKKVEDKLPDHLFLRIHRSFIINISEIVDIQDNSVLVKKQVIPVSRSNKGELMNRLNLL